MKFGQKYLRLSLTYSSTDNFLSPNPISDWFLFCCGNSMLHQKKEMEMIKTRFFMYKVVIK